MDNRRIGFFDSGIGGLTSIPYLMKEYPDEHVIFFGDTARTPYGSKSAHVIKRFTAEIGDFMQKNGVKMMVAACNTISATSLDILREKYPDIPVTGVIEPACDVVSKKCGKDDHVGILATRATVSTNAYIDAIRSRRPDMENIFQTACPAFVPLIEEGIIPVMAPLTHDGQGNILNTNADTIASETAKALAPYYDVTLIFSFEKKGVLRNPDDDDSVIPVITRADFIKYKTDGTISGGMLPKIENALGAIDSGVSRVIITLATAIDGQSGTIIQQ